MPPPAIVWFRQDLRLADNPALQAAVKSKRQLILAYILDDETPGPWKAGGASRWWLHKSLESLSADIAKLGGTLMLRRGVAATELRKLIGESGATAVFWNRCYEPYAIARDKALKEHLAAEGIEVESTAGALLFEPWTVKTKTGEPYKVYTPFWKACLQMQSRAASPKPKNLDGYDGGLASDALASWKLLPAKPNWATGFVSEWSPGEAGAHAMLDAFVEDCLSDYAEGRDRMGVRGTSRLSPHLHWGEISPVQVRVVVESAAAQHPRAQRGADKFLAEIGWRDFSSNLLFHWPSLPEKNWRAQFDAFPWRNDPDELAAWKHGRTGYPIVDAAMRELWTTGYMHNRARMIAASFLIKHLLIDWREGEAWFWDTLVDADLANNAASWQWVAGSGADASPYFRIFNPITQGERYDADGAYVRRWLPELANLSDSALRKPWEADAATLRDAGVMLGETYPAPIVDHALARNRALEAFASI